MTITPYLLYEDVGAAMEFLTRAFGFEEVLRYTGAEGYVNHAEMRHGDDVIYAGAQITQEPTDQAYGERRFGAADPEGHHWHFSQPIADVQPQDWGATTPD